MTSENIFTYKENKATKSNSRLEPRMSHAVVIHGAGCIFVPLYLLQREDNDLLKGTCFILPYTCTVLIEHFLNRLVFW